MEADSSCLPVVSLCYDSEGSKVFWTQCLTPENEYIFGNSIPTKITTDDTVEERHLVIKYSNTLCRAFDVSSSFGSYYRIDTYTNYEIDYGTYIVIGKTWIILGHDDGPMIIIISKEYKITQIYKLVEGNNYYLGRNKDLSIIISDDASVSGMHLYLSRSTNGTYVKFSFINLSCGKTFIFRIGVETFLKIELKDLVGIMKKKLRLSFVVDIEF